jgi:starch phosphorylase
MPRERTLTPTPARELADRVLHHVRYSLGRTLPECAASHAFQAFALALRERLIDGLMETEHRYGAADAKRVYYLSAEYLIGQSLRNNLVNLGVLDAARDAARSLGIDLEATLAAEPDAALGNGGLGRLAACFLESMASLDFPGYGYGINYQFGIFRQVIDNGCQHEHPDEWMAEGSPWQILRPDQACFVPVYGHVEQRNLGDGRLVPLWLGWQVIVGVPCDVPVVGYRGGTTNTLRLFSARSSNEFDMQIFNSGDYIRAVQQKIATETVSKVLYPSDSVAVGKELRLVQEYFLVACAIRDIARRYKEQHDTIEAFPDRVAIQLNDTHPSLAVIELMRFFVDEEGLPWDRAWEMTQAVCGYTNHTLLPEALEKWPIALLEKVLPRHLQMIYEINYRFLQEVRRRWPSDEARVCRLSLIEESPERQVRMAHVAIVGCHSVNGVAALHSELVKTTLVPDFHEMWPERFNNKTNGVTHRRWLLQANPALAELISARIGPGWVDDPFALGDLAPLARDPSTRTQFAEIRHRNKEALSRIVRAAVGVRVDPTSMFDVHVKRIHEYKRQLLNVLRVIHVYLGAVQDGVLPDTPRTVLFAGKAAPGYVMAKLIIRLIHGVADVVNVERRLDDRLKVVFLPDYRVSLAERIVPAADLSEQISTAGNEASGTGNMKLAMNGAVTIGTLDGANIEILDEVGAPNMYIFGLRVEEVRQARDADTYNPWDRYHGSLACRRVMDAIGGNMFCASHPGLFRPIHDAILYGGDRYMHLADLESYLEAQDRASADYRDPARWNEMAIRNVAGAGRFSSDRTIREYARDIWKIVPVAR